jgi:hypothetical protein
MTIEVWHHMPPESRGVHVIGSILECYASAMLARNIFIPVVESAICSLGKARPTGMAFVV